MTLNINSSGPSRYIWTKNERCPSISQTAIITSIAVIIISIITVVSGAIPGHHHVSTFQRFIECLPGWQAVKCVGCGNKYERATVKGNHCQTYNYVSGQCGGRCSWYYTRSPQHIKFPGRHKATHHRPLRWARSGASVCTESHLWHHLGVVLVVFNCATFLVVVAVVVGTVGDDVQHGTARRWLAKVAGDVVVVVVVSRPFRSSGCRPTSPGITN